MIIIPKIQATFQPIQVKFGDGDWQDLKNTEASR
ncbi:phage tail fiber C-terminal domain-containing protein [Salmonella enterica]|nr:phage tail fiber C-terminal domain-containing protein [Salmonella enterica]